MVDLTIFENRFQENFGAYVLNLGLSHYNYLNTQKLEMRFNWVQRNTINDTASTSTKTHTKSTHGVGE